MVVGSDAAREFVQRLVFMVVSGNWDAHWKNWSLIYPDRRTPKLAPLYDQVATVAWPALTRELALKFAELRSPLQVDAAAFGRLARGAGMPADEVHDAVGDALQRIGTAWLQVGAGQPWPPGHRDSLQEYWNRLPLVTGCAPFA